MGVANGAPLTIVKHANNSMFYYMSSLSCDSHFCRPLHAAQPRQKRQVFIPRTCTVNTRCPDMQAQPQNEMKPALTHQDQLLLKYLIDQPTMTVEEAWEKLPAEVRDWLNENGFSDPCYIVDPVDALVKLAHALAGDYDYNVHVVKTEHGDAIIIDIYTPGLGYDTVIVVLDNNVIAFQYG